jgi:hypothetical protein
VINYITDDRNRRTAVIIELKTIEDYQEKVEDLHDVIVAESRTDEPKRSWADVKRDKVYE